eukprot:6168632-Prymnesium_polylepis.1
MQDPKRRTSRSLFLILIAAQICAAVNPYRARRGVQASTPTHTLSAVRPTRLKYNRHAAIIPRTLITR